MNEKTLPYSTVAGVVTRRETFSQLLDYLNLCRDCCQRMSTEYYKAEDYAQFQSHLVMAEEAANVLGHLYNTEDDERSKLLSHGWYGVAEMFHNNREIFRQIMASPHTNKWRVVVGVFDKIIWQAKKIYEGKLQ